MIEILKRDVKTIRTIVAQIYNRLEVTPDTVRNLMATVIDNRKDRANPVLLDQEFFLPEVHEYVDEIVTSGKLETINFTVPLKGYDAAMRYNRIDIDRPGTVAKLERLAPQFTTAYFRKQVGILMAVFRLNPLAYDGQNFFDTDHVHPLDQGTYDNVLPFTAADATRLTFSEAQEIIRRIRERFTQNLSLQAEVIGGQEAKNSLIIVTHNSAHWGVFERVRTISSALDPNELAGTFTLLMDNKPTAGQENYIEAVMAEPGGPRPAFLVIDKDPVPDAWEEPRFRNDEVAVGLRDGIFGVKPGHPQTAIQVRVDD